MRKPNNRIEWTIHHKEITKSTNIDAISGKAGDVFTADFQLCGRGRLDHKWHSSPGENLMMSAVLDVANIEPIKVATLPLVIGLAVAQAVKEIIKSDGVKLKWPNDVFVDGRKIAGILCERHGDNVIAGVGINVKQQKFSSEIISKATSLVLLDANVDVVFVRDLVLAKLSEKFLVWEKDGFQCLLSEIRKIDFLLGRKISVIQTDDDTSPIEGICEGIAEDGSLKLSGKHIYAGEAHIVF